MSETKNGRYGNPSMRLMMLAILSLYLPSHALALDLNEVFDNTAVTAPSRVDYREERHNPMLKEPIVLTGYLEYLAQGHLRKVIETPFEESFLVADGNIEISRDGETRRLSLSKSKPIRTMLGGIEAILAGQTDRLSSMFDYELIGSLSEWSLQLVPKSGRVSKHLTSMQVTGNNSTIGSIRIDMKKGEWSLMEIRQPEPDL